jgi:hypothetical protein
MKKGNRKIKAKTGRVRNVHHEGETSPCEICTNNEKTLREWQPAIKKHGYIVLAANKDPPYSVTVGLTESYGFPELIISGHYPSELVQDIMKVFVKLCRSAGKLYSEPEFDYGSADYSLRIGIKEISRQEKLAHMILAKHKHGKDGFISVQLILPDRKMKLPWDEGYERSGVNQLLLYDHCWKCFKTEIRLGRCGGCNHTKYCGDECQKADWSLHKQHCEILKDYHDWISDL